MGSRSSFAENPPDGARGSRTPEASKTHLVLIPSFNSGRLLAETVSTTRTRWAPVWVVIDGSTDDSAAAVIAMAAADPEISVLHLPTNVGKGEAVRYGLEAARRRRFTHALVMDADCQHPPDCIKTFMEVSAAHPQALVLGQPRFGPDAPRARVLWRRASNAAASLITGRHLGDTLFGFRVYPIEALLDVMDDSKGMRRFDFDPEALIRLAWQRTPLIRVEAPVRYLSRFEGGVSHFHYLRDNLLLTRMYLRLGSAAIWRCLAGVGSRERR